MNPDTTPRWKLNIRKLWSPANPGLGTFVDYLVEEVSEFDIPEEFLQDPVPVGGTLYVDMDDPEFYIAIAPDAMLGRLASYPYDSCPDDDECMKIVEKWVEKLTADGIRCFCD